MDYLAHLTEELKRRDYSPLYIADCCEYASALLERELPVLFDREHIKQILRMKEVKFGSYTVFYVQGRHKTREIQAPSQKLKQRQRWILDKILSKVPMTDYAHGFIRGRSIVTNASIHVGQPYMLCMDIKDFFPTITQRQVENVFFSLGYTEEVSCYLAVLCCYNGVLPQGAPTSPYLANIICVPMDDALYKICSSWNILYTRYADDITFSGSLPFQDMILRITQTIEQFGFYINSEKTRVFSDKQRKLVTGLLVSQSCVRVPKQFKRKFAQEIHYCKRFGVAAHLENINSDKFVNYREHLYGKAYYIKMVEPELGERYLEQLDEIDWSGYA